MGIVDDDIGVVFGGDGFCSGCWCSGVVIWLCIGVSSVSIGCLSVSCCFFRISFFIVRFGGV